MSDFNNLSQRVHDVQSRFRAKREQEREQKEQLQSLVEAIERDSEQFNQERAAMREEIAALKQRVTQLEAQNEQLQDMLDGLLEALETGDEEDIGKALQDLEHRVAAIAQQRGETGEEPEAAQQQAEPDEFPDDSASVEIDEEQPADTREPAASLAAEDEDPFDWETEVKPEPAPDLDMDLELEDALEDEADNGPEAESPAASEDEDKAGSLGLQDAQSLIKALARIDRGLEERLGAVSADDETEPGYAAKVTEAKRKSELEGEELAQAAATGVRDILRRVQKRSQEVLNTDGQPKAGKGSVETDVLVLDEADEIDVLDEPENEEPRRAAS